MPLPTIPSGNVASATASTVIVSNSCRFNDDDTAYMHKTPSSSGSRRTFTFSTWWKQGDLASSSVIFSSGESDGDPNFAIYYNSSQQLNVLYYEGSSLLQLVTNAVYQDTGGWYHICVAIDTTQSTNTNRAKIYINGLQVTSLATATYCNQDVDISINTSSYRMAIGVGTSNGDAADGYAAETVFIDGSALAPTSFGEFDEDRPRIWKPIDVSGLTFGTNGFYLDYEDSSNLGNDVNGGTDLTEVNLAATDQTTDTPENNFATLNPLYNNSLVYTEGNCKITEAGDWQSSFSTIGATSGKWYMEFKCSASTGGTNNFSGGICALDGVSDAAIALTVPGGSGSSIISYGYENDGTKDVKNTSSSYGSTYGSASTDIIGVYMDLDNNKLYFAKNGTVQDSGTGISIDDGYTYGFTVGDYYGTSEANFGNPTFSISSSNSDPNGYGSFEYSTTITGDGSSKSFYALCTKNLAEYG